MKNKFHFTNLCLVISILIEGMWAYTKLPEKVASHWDAQGQVNGYMGKFGGAFFVPLLTLGLYLLFLIIPKIDPKKNVANFIDIYNRFVAILLLYMLYIYSLTIYFNLGHKFDFTRAILPAFGILFFFIGSMFSQAKPNWFVGIRTPWTLSNDTVWKKTHIVGGKLYKVSGVLALFGFIFPKFAFLFIMIPIIVSSIYLILYSFLEYRKIENE